MFFNAFIFTDFVKVFRIKLQPIIGPKAFKSPISVIMNLIIPIFKTKQEFILSY